ncbi:MAG: D-alanyl-D-alanine carboxypeptidase/D-alanyl-D-alanine-endopeptidase, partial [Candidatus Sericytochromatia bacterium]
MKKLFVSLIAISTLAVSSFSSFANDVSISEEGVSKIFNRAGISAKDSSAYVVSIKDGTTIFQHNINKPLMPASNLKLITSAASLALLKPEFRFKTVIYADSYVSSGVLNGNLYLKGYGDPDLTGERLWRMVKKLKNTGVTQITGDLIADESFFDDKEVSEGWNVRRYGDSVYSARVSALSVNRNIVDVW